MDRATSPWAEYDSVRLLAIHQGLICKGLVLTERELGPVGDTAGAATRATVVIGSTPRPVIGPKESDRAHDGSLVTLAVHLGADAHGQ